MIDVAAERVYPTPYANSPLLPLLLLTLARQRIAPRQTAAIKQEYDYIIGAGSSGSVVASRLSEEQCVSVLLLEAGKEAPLLTEVPSLCRTFLFTDIDWQYKTVPQKHTGSALINRQVVYPLGKGFGGSSLYNGLVYSRGNRKNYNDWVEKGAVGWSYEEVLPYFLEMEDNRDFEYVANGFHAVGGPMSVEKPRYHSEIKDAIFEAVQELGYEVVDPNGAKQTGLYDFQAFLKDGQRCNTAEAYLVPAENRTNLHILGNARVKKILMDGVQATGVQFDHKGRAYEIKAKREVIMAAGAINTAQLLMLSGIGPRNHLEKKNITVVADLPVGNNLQDHWVVFLNYEVDNRIPKVEQKLANIKNIEAYIHNRTGPLASAVFFSAVAFLPSETSFPVLDFPDYQLYLLEIPNFIGKQIGFKPNIYKSIYGPYENTPKIICPINILQPKSRGTVRLNSSNPYDSPLIDPDYFGDPRDIDVYIQGLKTCDQIANSEPMKRVGTKPFKTIFPGCEDFFGDEDRYFDCIIRSGVMSLSHPTGTAKMGDARDPNTVVDPLLRVKGVKGLRVVDASVMPIIPSGSPHAPVIMVAEKAADIIRDTIDCQNYEFESDMSFL